MGVLWNEASFQVEDFIRHIDVQCNVISSYSALFPYEHGDLNIKRKQLQLPCDVDARKPQYRPSNACNFKVPEM